MSDNNINMIIIITHNDDDIDIMAAAASAEPPDGKHKNRSPTTRIIGTVCYKLQQPRAPTGFIFV